MIYRKVYRRTWGDAKFRALSPIPPCGQGLWLWLLTGPFTGIIPGLLVVGERAMAERLKWPLKAFRYAYREVIAQGMIQGDLEAPLIFVPKALQRNRPNSLNVVKSWSREWDEVPECELKALCYQHFKAYLYGMSEAFGDTYAMACPMPTAMACAMQEQENRAGSRIIEQEKKKESISEDLAIFEAWKGTLPKSGQGRVKFTGKRKAKISARRSDGYSQDDLLAAVQGWTSDPWPDRKNQNSLEILLRDGAQVEKFSALFRSRRDDLPDGWEAI